MQAVCLYAHHVYMYGTPTYIAPGKMAGYKPELVILRGVAQLAEQSGGLYEWASNVVATACSERCNVHVCALLAIPCLKY